MQKKINRINTEAKLHKAHLLFTILFFFYGILWMFFVSFPYLLFNISTVEANFFIFVMAAIIVSGNGSAGISKRDFWCFIGPQLFSLFIFFCLTVDNRALLIMQMIALAMFTAYQYNQQVSTYKMWYNFTSDKLNQQYLLNSFPGFVSLLKQDQLIFSNQSFEKVAQDNKTEINNLIKEQLPIFLSDLQNEKSFELPLIMQGSVQSHLIIFHKLPGQQAILVGFNIQSQKDKEHQIQEQKMLLDQSSKMAALGEMSGGIAHEINNPLAVISLTNQRLKREFQKSEIEKESTFARVLMQSTEKIDGMIARTSKIITALRTFARDGSSDPLAKTSVLSLIEETFSFCENKFLAAQIKIVKNIDPNLDLMCRSTEVSQVLLNLFNNAYDALNENFNEAKPQKVLTILTAQTEQSVQILVKDNGKGIPLAIRDKIMQPFFTTKDVGQGTGLGLSISRSIMLSHNGRLFFDFSQVDETTAILEFPISTLIENPPSA